jgi:hypothetical protein
MGYIVLERSQKTPRGVFSRLSTYHSGFAGNHGRGLTRVLEVSVEVRTARLQHGNRGEVWGEERVGGGWRVEKAYAAHFHATQRHEMHIQPF